MWVGRGGREKREEQFGGIEPQKQFKVELIEWRSIDLHLINFNSTSAHPRAANAWEPILHVTWE
jgi:hypothetical protein